MGVPDVSATSFDQKKKMSANFAIFTTVRIIKGYSVLSGFAEYLQNLPTLWSVYNSGRELVAWL